MGAHSRLIDWVIVGGESGPGSRPMDLAWPRGLRDQCRDAGVAFYMKQLGAKPVSSIPGSWVNELQQHGPDVQVPFGRVVCGACGTEDCALGWPGHAPHTEQWRPLRHSHGGDMSEWPEDLRVREWPR